MKKNVILLVVAAAFSFAAIAQPTVDRKAKGILDAVSAKTKSYSSMKIDFTYNMENKKDNINESQEGVITLKGDKYNLKIAGQEIISDGKTVWSYLKDVNEVQINAPSTDPDALNPSTIFSIWENGFKYKYIKEENMGGVATEIVDLTPLEGKPYHKVRLLIDKAKSQLTQVSLYYKDGTVYSYKIKKFASNINVPDSQFSFDKSKYQGVEVIDMR